MSDKKHCDRTKPVIYQMLPRLFANYNANCVPSGTIMQNGCGKLNDITAKVLRQIADLGATHVWYTGVIEHAHCSDYTRYGIERDNQHVVKGQAGSPYAIKDYYDIDPDLAVDVPDRLGEFAELVKRTHHEGMKVIIDFVPNHVARRYHSDAAPKGVKDFGFNDDNTRFFAPDNNFYYIPRQQFAPSIDLTSGGDPYVEFPAKASGNDCFTAFPGRYDWYETVKLNYGVDYGDHSTHFDPIPDTWRKMVAILKYWARKGIDGFRCDMAHMVPADFWRWAIPRVKDVNPDIIFIAEIYDVCLYHTYIEAGFDYLYDKVNLYDTLRAIQTGNTSAAAVTSCWQTVDGIESNMLNFLENHDEQRFASKEYAGDASLAVPSLVISSMTGTGAMMIYAGQELGEKAEDAEGYSGADGRTTIFDYWSIPTLRRWLNQGNPGNDLLTAEEVSLRDTYRRILRLCNSDDAIACGGFFDLMYVNYDNPRFNPHRCFAFLRRGADHTLLIAVNFDSAAADCAINIPAHAFDCYRLAPRAEVKAAELLSGSRRRETKAFTPAAPFETVIPAHGAVIWRIDDACESEKPEAKAEAKPRKRNKKQDNTTL